MKTKELIIATRWEVKEINGERSIQLFDKDNNKIDGKDARWKSNFDCSRNNLTSLKGAPIEVGGYFNCSDNKLTNLEGAPREVVGYFNFYNNNLTSLKGAPREVGGSFYCSRNKLTNLEGAPEEVGGNFDCSRNNLTSLEGAPIEVGGYFNFYNNNLTSLEGAPREVGKSFYCSHNNLTSLKGAPIEVGGIFECSNNNLTSLKGAPKEVGGSFYCSNNNLTSLEGAPKEVGGSFDCFYNNLKSLEGAPKEKSKDVKERIFRNKLKRGYVFADRILDKLLETTTEDNLTIYKTRKIGSKDIRYVVYDGTNFSHGETIEEAKNDLLFKISDRNTDQYNEWSITDIKDKHELVIAYRKITGACLEGVKDFLNSNDIPDKVRISDAIKMTKGNYGHEEFKSFFK